MISISVVERLQALGDFSVKLRPGVPTSVLDALHTNPFSHLIITPSRVFPKDDLIFESSAENPTQKVVNGGFESGTLGWEFGVAEGPPRCFVPFTISSAQAASGTSSAAYTSTTYRGNSIYQQVPVTPGRQYTFSFKTFCQEPSDRLAKVALYWWASTCTASNLNFFFRPSGYVPSNDPAGGLGAFGMTTCPDGTTVPASVSSFVSQGAAWATTTTSFTVPNDIHSVIIQLSVSGSDPNQIPSATRCAATSTGGTWYFDDVSLVPSLLSSDDSILSAAVYTGVVTAFEANRLELSGSGMAWWLGDDEGKGPVYETFVELTDGTFTQWITALLGTLPSIRVGTVIEPSGGLTLSRTFAFVTPREALDTICRFFNCEWRIRPNGIVDAGPAQRIFQSIPRFVFLRRSALPEVDRRAVIAQSMARTIDGTKYATKTLVLGSGFGVDIPTGDAVRATVPYKDLYGNDINHVALIDDPGSGDANNIVDQEELAQAYLDRENVLKTVIECDTGELDVGMPLSAGDWVYVHDPILSIEDGGYEIVFQGEVLHPVLTRIAARTWNIRDGMGVYFRKSDGSGNIVDLSAWIEDEGGGGGGGPPPQSPIRVASSLEELVGWA